MFDIGMSELLIVGIVALIVVGPKDLPGMFHTLGRFTAKIKAMGREFSRAMESAAKEAGVDDIKDSLNAAANPKKFGLDKLKDAASDFEKWDPLKSDTKKAAAAAEMSEERAEMARKINESAAAKATARKADEAAKAEAAASEPKTEASKAATKKTATKTAAAKKAPAKKAAAKPSAKPAAAKKPAAKAAAPKKAAKAAPKAAAKATAAKTAKPKAAQTKKEGEA